MGSDPALACALSGGRQLAAVGWLGPDGRTVIVRLDKSVGVVWLVILSLIYSHFLAVIVQAASAITRAQRRWASSGCWIR